MNELPRTLVIDFDPPITFNGVTYSSIELHEPNVQQTERAYADLNSTTNMQSYTKYKTSLLTEVTGLPRAVISLMPISKLNEGFNYLNGFINATPTTDD